MNRALILTSTTPFGELEASEMLGAANNLESRKRHCCATRFGAEAHAECAAALGASKPAAIGSAAGRFGSARPQVRGAVWMIPFDLAGMDGMVHGGQAMPATSIQRARTRGDLLGASP